MAKEKKLKAPTDPIRAGRSWDLQSFDRLTSDPEEVCDVHTPTGPGRNDSNH